MRRLIAAIWRTRGSTYEEIARVIKNLLEENRSAKFLDLGCSNGGLTLELAERIGTSEIYGIEIADEWREQLKDKGIKVYWTDLNEVLPLENEAFDVVHSNQVLEHIYNTDLHIKEIHRILKRGGYAIISTPNLAALYNIFFLTLGLQPPTAWVSDELVALGNPLSPHHKVKRELKLPAHSHLRIFTLKALKELFQYHGFKVEKIVGVGYYPFPVPIARFLSRLDSRHAVCLTMKARKL